VPWFLDLQGQALDNFFLIGMLDVENQGKTVLRNEGNILKIYLPKHIFFKIRDRKIYSIHKQEEQIRKYKLRLSPKMSVIYPVSVIFKTVVSSTPSIQTVSLYASSVCE
jgi:hypothetical protein